jgi:hypothetical protein
MLVSGTATASAEWYGHFWVVSEQECQECQLLYAREWHSCRRELADFVRLQALIMLSIPSGIRRERDLLFVRDEMKPV